MRPDGLRHRRTGVPEALRDARTQGDDVLLLELEDRAQVHLGGVDEICHSRHPRALRGVPPAYPVRAMPRRAQRLAATLGDIARNGIVGAIPRLPRIEPCPTSSFPVTSCPPTDASDAARRRCRGRTSRRSSAAARRCSAPRTVSRPSRTSSAACARALTDLFRAPTGYEVILGNGGSTAFWDAAAFGLIESRSQNLVFGEFGGKFAAAAKTPWLQAPDVREVPPGRARLPSRSRASTCTPGRTTRPPPASRRRSRGCDGDDGALTVIDATSAAGGIDFSIHEADVYYFAPQKNLGSDGGLWFAIVSPAAIERIERIAASGRYIPEFLSLKNALDNSRLNQTLNTPALATLFLLNEQLAVDHRATAGCSGPMPAPASRRARCTTGPRHPPSPPRSSPTPPTARRSS